MKAYLNNPQLKQDFLAEIRKHQEADAIVQGIYGDGESETFKGCAVGCSIRSLNILKGKKLATNDHACYESELGIPEALARLEDRIFEGLPVDLAKQWPLRFSEAITPGADLSMVMPRFLVWLMGDLEQYATEDVKTVLRRVAGLYERRIAGDEPTEDEWNRAAWAARADSTAAWEATWAAGAARAAAWEATWAAGAARAAAWAAWAAEAAEAAAYEKMADKLIELLAAA